MVTENDFTLGDIVFLKTDTEQKERMVTAIQVTFYGVLYWLACAGSGSWHSTPEISTEKNILKQLNIHQENGD